MNKLFIYSALLIFISHANAADINVPGRTLPGGTWQARNTQATNQESIDNDHNPFDIFTEWGTDVRLTYFEQPHAHWPEIAASGPFVYVAWWYLDDSIFMARSTDWGQSWENFKLFDDSTTNEVVPQISASDSNVYVVCRGARPWWGIYLRRSHDWGENWNNSRIYYTGRNYSENPVVANSDSSVWVIFSIEVNYVPPTDWDLFCYRSRDYGVTFADTFFLSDTTSSGLGPDLAINCLSCQTDPVLHLVRQKGIDPSTQEILYQRSTDGGQTWTGPLIISHYDTIHSQWPQVAAWGDSFVAVTWMDYKYSQEAFSGDAFVTLSTDNGESWEEPAALTSRHKVSSSDVAASGDTLVLVYQEGFPPAHCAVYANVSYDGGETWEGEALLSDDTTTWRIEPSVAISDSCAHVAWSDGRENPGLARYEIYYDRAILDSAVLGISEDESIRREPSELSLRIFPNPFNSKTIFSIAGNSYGHTTIAIYDLCGRLVRKLWEDNLGGGEKRIVWDATDGSGKPVGSGIYFAVASTPQTRKSSKLVLLR